MYKNKSKLYFYAIISLLVLTNISGLLYSNDVNATDVPKRKRNLWTLQEDNQLIAAVVAQYQQNGIVDWVSVAEQIQKKSRKQCRQRWVDVLDSNIKKGPWTPEENNQLIALVAQYGAGNWAFISDQIPGKNAKQCMSKWINSLDPSIKRGNWAEEEDNQLRALVAQYGAGNWAFISDRIPGRNAKQCRERWTRSLNPDLEKGHWTKEEDEILLKKYNEFGSKWANIKNYLPCSSQNAIKNRFYYLTQRNRTTLDSLQNPTDVDNNAPRNIFAGQNMMTSQAFFAPAPNYFAYIQAPVAVNIPVANPIVIQAEEMEDYNTNVNNNALVGQNIMAPQVFFAPAPNYFAYIQAPVAVNIPNIVNIPVANPDTDQEEQEEQVNRQLFPDLENIITEMGFNIIDLDSILNQNE